MGRKKEIEAEMPPFPLIRSGGVNGVDYQPAEGDDVEDVYAWAKTAASDRDLKEYESDHTSMQLMFGQGWPEGIDLLMAREWDYELRKWQGC